MWSQLLLLLWMNFSAVMQSHWSCSGLTLDQKTLRFISQLLPSHPLISYLTSVHSTSTRNPFHELNFPSHLLLKQGCWRCSCYLIEHIPLQNTGAHWTSRSIGHLELRGWATSAPHTLSVGRSEGWGGGGVWKLEAGLTPYAELKHGL